MTCRDRLQTATDLAVLYVLSPLPSLEVAQSYDFKRGDEVLIIGSPVAGDDLLLENAIARGLMSTKTTIDDRSYYQLGIAVNPGNSGGPVIDRQGRVIGVVTAKAAEQEALAFSIPPEDVNAALDSVGTQTEEDSLRVGSLHRAVTAFRFIQVCSGIYAEGLKCYAGAMEQAIQQGDKPGDGIGQASAQIDQRVAVADGALSPDLQQFVSAVSSDRRLHAPIRDQIVELWTTYKQMKNAFDHPGGTYNEYRVRISQLIDKHRQLTDSLQILLGEEDLIKVTFSEE